MAKLHQPGSSLLLFDRSGRAGPLLIIAQTLASPNWIISLLSGQNPDDPSHFQICDSVALFLYERIVKIPGRLDCHSSKSLCRLARSWGHTIYTSLIHRINWGE